MLCARSVSGPPTGSLNFSLADSAGGDPITVTGANLAGATVTVGGTSATVTASTYGSLTFTMPAKTAKGSGYDVVLTNAVGTTTLAGALEAWAPSDESGCTSFAERPNYASAAGVGSWTMRIGSTPWAIGSSAPAASGGSPEFTGPTVFLEGPTIASCFSSTQGTMSFVLNVTSAGAVNSGSPFNEDGILCDKNLGSIGAGASANGSVLTLRTWMTDGTYKNAAVNTTLNALHAFSGRFNNADFIQSSLDGSAYSLAQTALGTRSVFAATARIGSNYVAGHGLKGEMRAAITHSTKVSDAFAAKFYAWSRCRHGVA